MARFDVSQIKDQPTQLLDFLKENRYGIFHRSNIFFRDFQYGLWRFLRKDQAKVPYAKIEELAREVIADWESKGIMKRIDRQSYELNMPAYSLIDPATLAAQEAPAPVAQKAAAPGAPAAAAGAADPEKAAKIAELQAKMAAAKAKREGSTEGDAPSPAAAAEAAPSAATEEASSAPAAAAPTAAPVASAPAGSYTPLTLWIPPGADDAKRAQIAELETKMNAARARAASGE